MRNKSHHRTGFGGLELLLALAVLALVLQMFPRAGKTVLWMLDVRNWPRTVWFGANLVVLLVLVGVRFGPQVVEDWRTRRERLASEHARHEKEREIRAQREALERMQEAKRKRIY